METGKKQERHKPKNKQNHNLRPPISLQRRKKNGWALNKMYTKSAKRHVILKIENINEPKLKKNAILIKVRGA